MNSPDSYALIADLYDHVALYRARPDVDFYVEAARQSGGPVLEIGCGTGRVLIPSARSGVKMVGLDLSTAMLDICRRRVGAEPVEIQSRIQLLPADMREFSLPQLFKLVTIPFRPFQHLQTVADQLSCLRSIHRALDDQGMLIFDVFNPSLDALVNQPMGTEIDEETEASTPDGRRILRRFKAVAQDRFNQVNHIELIHYVTHPDGREERLVFPLQMRYLFRFEAEHLLSRAGFKVEEIYADFDKSPYGSKYPGELIFVARKL